MNNLRILGRKKISIFHNAVTGLDLGVAEVAAT